MCSGGAQDAQRQETCKGKNKQRQIQGFFASLRMTTLKQATTKATTEADPYGMTNKNGNGNGNGNSNGNDNSNSNSNSNGKGDGDGDGDGR
jgi:hypothetical protein